MPKHRWANLSQETRELWDKIAEKDKGIILGHLDKRNAMQRVNLHDISVQDFLQAHLHEFKDTHEDVSTDLKAHNNNDEVSDGLSLLINSLTTGKKFSPGDIRRVLSSSNAKKDNMKSGFQYQTNTHIIYRANTSLTDSCIFSLIDRGANGGVAGQDVRIIYHTDRKVDIVGIDNHMINDVYIGTAGGIVDTDKGPVVLILHQYALLSKGKTIHAPGQLEWYGNDVNDKSSKVGGLQRIATHDGYIIPNAFDRGLLRLLIRPFTDAEFDSLPHVIFTNELEWDPTVLDLNPNDHENWFDAVSI